MRIALVWLSLIPVLAHSVATSSGEVQGLEEDNRLVFKGIPYAQAPVGELRWQAPKSPKKSDVSAESFAPNCPQVGVANTSEDCLYLNVWTNGLEGDRPVMVWVHGGGFRAGSGDIDGHALAQEDVVVVSFNYRLGPLGHFAHEALNGAANFAILDMVAALDWVQDNISQFGGDPANVTIFGVSAGGQAVNLLMSSPLAHGRFHRAIAQSGYGTWPLPRVRGMSSQWLKGWDGQPVADAHDVSRTVSQKVSNDLSLEALRKVPADEWMQALTGFQLPIVDGVSLPDEPAVVFMAGRQAKVPYMTGGNSYEGSVLGGSGVALEDVKADLSYANDAVMELYADDVEVSEDQAWQRLFGDMRYVLSAAVMSEAMATVQQPSWLYFTDFVPKAYRGEWLGTPHAVETMFLLAGHKNEDPEVQALAQRMRGYWTNFARVGNPNGEGDQTWPASVPGKTSWLVLGVEDSPNVNPLGAKLALLTGHYLRRHL